MFDGDAFDAWLKKGPERFPRLYGGQIISPVALEPAKAVSVRPVAPVVEPARDFKSAASGEDAEEVADWDGREE